MRFFVLFLLISLSVADFASKQCGIQVHRHMRFCMSLGMPDKCYVQAKEMNPACIPMLEDAKVCYPSLMKLCSLSVTPWKNNSPEDEDVKTEEILMEGTIRCISDNYPMLDVACQNTPTIQSIKERAVFKRCMGASGAYLRECRFAAEDDFNCKFRLARLQSMGCDDVLADMQTCAGDVEAFCPLPPPRPTPSFPMPIATPVSLVDPLPSISVGVYASTVQQGIPQTGSADIAPSNPDVVTPGGVHNSGKHRHHHNHDTQPPTSNMPPPPATDNSNIPPTQTSDNSFTPPPPPPPLPEQTSEEVMNPSQGSSSTPGNQPQMPSTSTVSSAWLVGGMPMQQPGVAGSQMPGVAVDPSTSNQATIMPFPTMGFHGECKLVRKMMKHCIATHLDEFSSQCQNTELMQIVRRHLREERLGHLEDAIWGPRRFCHRVHRRFACLAVALVVALVCLVWLIKERKRRARLREDRQAGAALKLGTWSTGLFGSWTSLLPDWRTCLPSFLCPQLQTALNQAELDDRNVAMADVCVNLYKPMMMTNIYRDRTAIRAKFDIPDAPCEDMLTSVLCTPCAVAQHAREIDARANVCQGGTPFAYQAQVNSPNSDTEKPAVGVPLAEIMKL